MPTGELEPLHQHDWQVEAVFQGPRLDGLGMLVEFVSAEQSLRAVLEPLRQANLNATPMLAGASPTAEQVARHLFSQLRRRLGPQAPLKAVYVWETPDRAAAYWESTP